MESSKTQEMRDWSSLLPELLNVIATNIRDISDFVRFRAVCTVWRFSTSITDLPPQFPWILDYSNPFEDEIDWRFYSVPSNKIHTIHATNVLKKFIFPRLSVEGHLLLKIADTIDYCQQFSLLNPLTNEHVVLPAFEFGYLPYWVGYQKNQKADNLICCAIVKYNSEHKLVTYHLGEDSWCELGQKSKLEFCKLFYLKGMIFTVERDTGVTKVTDITAGSSSYSVPSFDEPFRTVCIHLVEISGDIYRVDRNHYNHAFRILRMDTKRNGSRHWVRVNSIGNYALFVDRGCFAIRANDSCEIRANCIYVINNASTEFLVERINIMTNARESLPCPFKRGEFWFVPNLQHRFA